MKKLLALAAMAEAALGVALVVDPSLLILLLLGATLAGLDGPAAVGAVIGRVTGIALIALGVSCWPGSTALAGMLTYGLFVTVYLAGHNRTPTHSPPSPRPAVAFHVVLSALLARAWVHQRPKRD